VIPRPRGGGEPPVPKHPYRDSAIVNTGLAGRILLIAWLTGGDLTTAVFVAAGFFVIATAWNWWRFRQRLAAQDAAERRAPE
jgi:hypothetical protein